MKYAIRNETIDIKPCLCGSYPDFMVPDPNYTDCWLKCPKCGRSTKNTGGYNYAEEIPLHEAQREAAKLWNESLI
jgi:hypothetical protein